MLQSIIGADERTTSNTFAEARDVLKAIDAQIRVLIQNHRKMSKRWMPHEVVPWGAGEDFTTKPWSPEQCHLRPEIVIALETNLLTEDNLPYYYASIAKGVEPESALGEWSRLWTSEEASHGTALRDYMLLMRVIDPVLLEHNRLKVMQRGFYRPFGSPFELFAYTTAQELSTRISHLRTGKKADEPVLCKLLELIAQDENFHFIFYRSVVKAILEIAPELMLPAIATQLYGFGMPGDIMDDFSERSAVFESEEIFGAIDYRDHVVAPILTYWKIANLRGLPPHIEKVQERILKLESVLTRMIERSLVKRNRT
jgi:acyl-[acyl-carrier-protein] desaturase